MKYITTSEKQTYNFAKKIAAKLKGGEVLALIGDLGAGKTVFARGLAAGLGIKKNVNSPTFVLMRVYSVKSGFAGPPIAEFNKVNPVKNQAAGIRQFVHIDAYRLKTGEDLKNIGVEDFLGKKDTVVLIEWADRVKKMLPKKVINIKITGSDNKRVLIIK